jgi:hypothetical protein
VTVPVLLQQTIRFVGKLLAVRDVPAKLLLVRLDILDFAVGRRRHRLVILRTN